MLKLVRCRHSSKASIWVSVTSSMPRIWLRSCIKAPQSSKPSSGSRSRSCQPDSSSVMASRRSNSRSMIRCSNRCSRAAGESGALRCPASGGHGAPNPSRSARRRSSRNPRQERFAPRCLQLRRVSWAQQKCLHAWLLLGRSQTGDFSEGVPPTTCAEHQPGAAFTNCRRRTPNDDGACQSARDPQHCTGEATSEMVPTHLGQPNAKRRQTAPAVGRVCAHEPWPP